MAEQPTAALVRRALPGSDDGVGFDTSIKKKGIGLKNIASRADSLKGKLIINSQPGEGCELIVNFSTASNYTLLNSI